jgi:ATP-binding cassette, subfamily B, bacterial
MSNPLSNGRAHQHGLVANYRYMLAFGWRYARPYLIATFGIAIVHQLVIFFEHVYSIKFIIDTVQFNRPFSHVLIYIGTIAACVLLCITFNAWLGEYYALKSNERVHWALQQELFAQAARLDLASYDDPSYYNDFVQAINEAPQRFDAMIEHLKDLCARVVMVLSAATFVLLIDPAAFIFVFLGLGLSLFIARRQGTIQFALESESLPAKRKQGYLTRVFYLADHAKELRLSQVSEKLLEEYDQSVAERARIVSRHGGALRWLTFLQGFVFDQVLFHGLLFSYLIVRALVWKQITLGDLVALHGTVMQIVLPLKRMINNLPEMQKASLYVQTMRTFRSQQPAILAPASPLPLPQGPCELELRGVSFAYPSAGDGPSAPILQDINLRILPQEKIAIVGHNGAGKTTLTKLIMRLYDPSAGCIYLNGIDIRSFDPAAYRALIATVFQDFQIFAATVAENVLLDLPGNTDGEQELLRRALAQSGFTERLATMELGLDTPLTREFDEHGVNLSGGENQKIALARVFSRTNPAAILDEPSSALDPESEYRLNQNMAEAARFKSVIYISHRLSSTRMADRIIYLEKGRIVEEGTHAQLIGLNGHYARIFGMQAERYRPPPVG